MATIKRAVLYDNDKSVEVSDLAEVVAAKWYDGSAAPGFWELIYVSSK